MAKQFRGSAGDIPDRKAFGGDKGKWRDKGFRLYEPVRKANRDGILTEYAKKVVPLKLEKGEASRPLVVLDEELDYAVRMHYRFEHDKTWENYVMCRSAVDDLRGCPLCDVIERRYSWFAVMTVIDQKPWIVPDGKNKGKEYSNFRRLVLIPDRSLEKMNAVIEDAPGWRGAAMKVSRSTDDKSLRIGDSWVYNFKRGNLSETEMMDEFEGTANDYGLSVEAFCSPFDYDTVLRVPTYEEALKIAQEITRGAAGSPDAPKALAEAGSGGDDGKEEALPF